MSGDIHGDTLIQKTFCCDKPAGILQLHELTSVAGRKNRKVIPRHPGSKAMVGNWMETLIDMHFTGVAYVPVVLAQAWRNHKIMVDKRMAQMTDE